MVGAGMRTDRPPPFLTPSRFWLPQDTARYGNLLTLRNFIFEMGRYNDVALDSGPPPPSDTPPPNPPCTAIMTVAVWRYKKRTAFGLTRYLLLIEEELRTSQRFPTDE